MRTEPTSAASAIFAANRAQGSVRFDVHQVEGATRRRQLHESGSLRVRFPSPEAEGLSAVFVNTAGGIAGGARRRRIAISIPGSRCSKPWRSSKMSGVRRSIRYGSLFTPCRANRSRITGTRRSESSGWTTQPTTRRSGNEPSNEPPMTISAAARHSTKGITKVTRPRAAPALEQGRRTCDAG